MSLIKCVSCSTDISPKAITCPKCGHPNKEANNLSGGQVVSYLIVAGVTIWWLSGGGIQGKVATDAENQYQIAKRQGDSIQVCVQAGIVSAAYLQAKDESNYQKWKGIESADCRQAGLPR